MRKAFAVVAGGAAIAAMIAGPLAGGASAQKNSSTTPSIALAPGDPSLGETVSFVTVYPNNTQNPSIELNCYQNGTVVWGYVGLTTDTYKLGGDSSPWLTNGGAASCVADLMSISWSGKNGEQMAILATTSFDATA